MPLLDYADMPTIHLDALEPPKPKRDDREVEQHRFIQVGHQRVGHRVDWSERRDVVALARDLDRVGEQLPDLRRKIHDMPPS
jgi:hypothetical protein